MNVDFVPATVRAAGFLALVPWWQSPAQKFLLLTLAGFLAISAGGAGIFDNLRISQWPAEFLLGAAVALPALLFVNAAELLGELYDFARGQTLAAAYDPTLAQAISSSAQLFRKLACLSLLTAPGLALTLGSYFHSLEHVSNASVVMLRSDALGVWAIRYICLWLGVVAQLAVALTLVFLSIDLSLGFIARVLPSLSVSTEGFVLKSGVGMLLLLNAASFDLSQAALKVLSVAWPWEVYG